MRGLQDVIFLGEILLQSKIALRAAERLKATQENFDQVEVWCSIQSILVSAGNISKILWPQEKKYKNRGERLRSILKIEEDNILSDRKFRNHFEHYDSRIEEYFRGETQCVYIDLAMNPSLSGRQLRSHRGYNSFNNTLEFRGQVLDLDKVLISLAEILSKCKAYCLDFP